MGSRTWTDTSPDREEGDAVAKTHDDLQDVQVIGASDQKGLTFKRHFSTKGTHPFDQVEWETRDAIIPNFKEGGNAFEQRGVEFPVGWSQNATNIVAQKRSEERRVGKESRSRWATHD